MSPRNPDTMPAQGVVRFEEHFGRRPEATYFSPGRINLIGEHTDYNGGWVLPMAIHLGNRFIVGSQKERRVRIFSSTFAERIAIRLDDVESLTPEDHWQDYFVGVIREFAKHTQCSTGLDILVDSTLPAACGLSSSASITTGLATILNDFWGTGFARERLAMIARSAENQFVGVACGILDPFAILHGRAGHAIALDCSTLEWEPVPFPDGFVVVAADTGVPRRLSDSQYNRRREECERALELVRPDLDVQTLSDLSVDDLANAHELHEDNVALRRARHVVAENLRVRTAAQALALGDMVSFGQQLVASHRSLRDDFEVSCRELDIMADEAIRLPGVVGAKMTGAGFGGSVIAVVTTDSVDDVTSILRERYRSRAGYEPEFHTCRPSPGVYRIETAHEQ